MDRKMSVFIDREKAIARIKAAYCCGCENYNGIKCRACQINGIMGYRTAEDVLKMMKEGDQCT